jgi:UDP-galactopyranose mutase
MKYDYLIVGCGLYGAVFAQQAKENGKKCLIIDKRDHIGGNCYTEKKDNIDIHRYGPHIFHTNSDKIWQYVNQFAQFNNFVNRPKVYYKNKIYSFPINLMTLYQLWGVTTPAAAIEKLNSVKIPIDKPTNLEEWVLSQVGEEIYKTFIYGYTKKQWGTEPKNLPSFIIKRLPIRLTFDDNYYFDKYQGIPTDGYANMISNMIEDIECELGVDYFQKRSVYDSISKTVVYTGPIDRFFDFQYGKLEYRTLSFETTKLDISDFQGNAIMNFTSTEYDHTRIVEHKHFNLTPFNNNSNITYITKEFSTKWTNQSDPYYPINNQENNNRYNQYSDLIKNISANKYLFGGRLAEYKYYDMHQVIGSALKKYSTIKQD